MFSGRSGYAFANVAWKAVACKGGIYFTPIFSSVFSSMTDNFRELTEISPSKYSILKNITPSYILSSKAGRCGQRRECIDAHIRSFLMTDSMTQAMEHVTSTFLRFVHLPKKRTTPRTLGSGSKRRTLNIPSGKACVFFKICLRAKL